MQLLFQTVMDSIASGPVTVRVPDEAMVSRTPAIAATLVDLMSLFGSLDELTQADLAACLPCIDVSFNCKVCNVHKASFKDLVLHVRDSKCAKTLASGPTEKSKPVRKRGRPRGRCNKPRVIVSKLNTDVGEGATVNNACHRMTRMSTGSIQRKNAAELLGLNIKHEGEGTECTVTKAEDDSATVTPIEESLPEAVSAPSDQDGQSSHIKLEGGGRSEEKKSGSSSQIQSDGCGRMEQEQTFPVVCAGVKRRHPDSVTDTEIKTEPDSKKAALSTGDNNIASNISCSRDAEKTSFDALMCTVQTALEQVASQSMSIPGRSQIRIVVVNHDPETGQVKEEDTIIKAADNSLYQRNLHENTIKAIALHVTRRAVSATQLEENSRMLPVTVKVGTLPESPPPVGNLQKMSTGAHNQAGPGTGSYFKLSHASSSSAKANKSTGTENKVGAISSNVPSTGNVETPVEEAAVIKDTESGIGDYERDAGQEEQSAGDPEYIPKNIKDIWLSPEDCSRDNGTNTDQSQGIRARPKKLHVSAYLRKKFGLTCRGLLKRPHKCPICRFRYFSTTLEYDHHMACHVYKERPPKVESIENRQDNVATDQNEQTLDSSQGSASSKDGDSMPSPMDPVDGSSQKKRGPKNAEAVCDEIRAQHAQPAATQEPPASVAEASEREQDNAGKSKPQVSTDIGKSPTQAKTKPKPGRPRKGPKKHPIETWRDTFKCQHCPFQKIGWNDFLRHMLTHGIYKDKLKSTVMAKNIMGEFPCSVCNRVFEKKTNMRSHMKRVHQRQPMGRSCPVCKQTLDCVDDKTYIRHVEKCKNIRTHCPNCPYSSVVSANMRRHMKIHRGEGYSCEVCGKMFPTRQRCDVHSLTHTKNRPRINCEHCDNDFCSLDAMKKHVARKHTESTESYPCPTCGFVAQIKSDLTKHEKMVHNKRYRCPSCPFQTNSQSSYHLHQENHGPNRMYACSYAGCYYRGSSKKQLADHCAQVHLSQPRFQCPMCNKLLKKKTHLLRHLAGHTGDRPYSCQECGEAFHSHSTYYRHKNKTGHDRNRETVASVPQNIQIAYMNLPREQPTNVLEECVLPSGDDSEKLLLQASEFSDNKDYTCSLPQNVVEVPLPIHSSSTGIEPGEVVFIDTTETQFLEEIGPESETVAVLPSSAASEQTLDYLGTEDSEAEALSENVPTVTNPPVTTDSSVLQQLMMTDLPYPNVTSEVNVVSDTEADKAVAVSSQDGAMLQQISVQDSPGKPPVTYLLSPEEAEALLSGRLKADDLYGKADLSSSDMTEASAAVYQDSIQQVETLVGVSPPGDKVGEQQYAILVVPQQSGEPEAALSMLQLQSTT